MLRLLVFLTVILLFGLLGAWLLEHDGVVSITWLGYRIETTSTFALAAVLVATVSVAFLVLLLGWIGNTPHRFSKIQTYKKRDKGLVALGQGFAAVAAGDRVNAQELAYKAERYLGETPLTLLLHTQTAQLLGKDTKLYLTALATHKETEIIALKGLLLNARNEGNLEEAVALAERAYRLNPDASGISQVLADLYKRSQQWQKGKKILEDAIKHHRMDTAKAQHDLGIILLAESSALLASNQPAVAYQNVKQARKYLPQFAPLEVCASQALVAMGKKRKAAQLLETAWKNAPHPNLAEGYLALYKEEPETKQLKRMEFLASTSPKHPESLLSVAKAAIAAKESDKARYALTQLLPQHQTARAYKLLAEVEKLDGKRVDAIETWLAKAASAPPDPAWVCQHCRYTAEHWASTCPNCQGFDSFSWAEGHVAYALI